MCFCDEQEAINKLNKHCAMFLFERLAQQ